MSNQYNIGQVLYIISPKTQTVVPVQIQEINQRTTIEGQETIYMIVTHDGRGPHNLESINGKIFISATEASKFLKESANRAIDVMIQEAEQIAKQSFGNTGGVDDIFPAEKTVTPSNKSLTPPKTMQQVSEKVDGGVQEVEVIDKDGKSRIQKTKIKSIKLPDFLGNQTVAVG